jgi:hypothetical protein
MTNKRGPQKNRIAGGPPALQSGLAASFGQLVGAGEIDPVTGLGCGAGHPDGQHRLTGAGWSDEHHIAGVIEEAQRCQLADEFLVDAGLCGEVECVEAGLGW